MSQANSKTLEFATQLIWDGNRGSGTSSYTSYGREYRVRIGGKPDLLGTAASAFKGDPKRHDPEDLFVAAVSSCHMLSYLALCARRGLRVIAYEDDAIGRLLLDVAGGGAFSEVTLRPRVTIADATDEQIARELHAEAHARCFIASSCRVPIKHEPSILLRDPNPSERVS